MPDRLQVLTGARLEGLETIRESPAAEGLPLWFSGNPSASAGEARDSGSIPGSGKSPGGVNGTFSSILA